MSLVKFELTERHLTLLKQLQADKIQFLTNPVEGNSPFGGNNVYEDVDLILHGKPENFDPLTDEAREYSDKEMEEYDKLVGELETALSIVLSTGAFEAGRYKRRWHEYSWRKY